MRTTRIMVDLSSNIAGLLKNEEKTDTHTGKTAMWQGKQRLKWCNCKAKDTKECQQEPETKKRHGRIPS